MSVSVEPCPSVLPIVYTAAGCVEGDTSSEDLRHGFLLRELGNPLDLPGADVHHAHAQAAASVLEHAGILVRPQVILEERLARFSRHTLPHVDGMDGTFYQVNTLLPSSRKGTVLCSRLDLTAYDLTKEEHARLTELFPPDKLPDARSSVYANRWLGRALWGRSPDAAWEQTSQPHDTIVFPNGYDIRAGSRPSRLYLHEFRTVTDPEQLYSKRDERYLDLSRITGSVV